MPQVFRNLTPRAANWLTISFLLLLPPLFFWRETLGWLRLGIGDAAGWFFPIYKLSAEQLRAGRWPLWNPYLYSGTPLFAQLQVGVLDPLNWIYLLGATSRTLTIAQEASFAIALIAAYSYIRSLGWRRRAGVVAAGIYALSGFAVARTLYPAMLHVVALAPLVLCFIERSWQHGRWRDTVGGALVICWQIFAAHPQPLVYSSLLAASYALFCAIFRHDRAGEWGNAARLRFLARCAGMFAAGAALSAVQLLPSLELASQSVRRRLPYGIFAQNSLHPASLLTALFPFFHGEGKGPYHLPYWGTYWQHQEAQIYLGVLALSLAAAGAWCGWRVRAHVAIFWSLAGVVGVVLALGYYLEPVAKLVYHVPLLGNFRSPNRHWMAVALAVAVLAGYAVERFLSGEERRLARSAQFTGGALTLLCAVIGASILQWREGAEELIRKLPDLSIVPRGFLRAAGAELYLPVISAVCLLTGLIVFARAQSRARWYPLLLALLLVDYHLYALCAPINDPIKLETLVGRAMPPELAARQSEREPLRYHIVHGLTASGHFYPYWFYGHEMATGADPLVNERYKTLTGVDDAGYSTRRELFEAQDRTLDLLNVRYVLLPPDVIGPPRTEGVGLGDATRWRELTLERMGAGYERLRVYENLRALPRVWLVGQVELRPDAEQWRLIRGEMAGAFDPRAVALVEPGAAARLDANLLRSQASHSASSLAGQIDGSVRIIERGSARLRIEAQAARPAMLVISEMYFPGWRARVDGHEVELWRVDYLLRGVALAPGKHTVELVYRPRSLLIGTVSSAVTVAVMLWLVLWEKRKSRP